MNRKTIKYNAKNLLHKNLIPSISLYSLPLILAALIIGGIYFPFVIRPIEIAAQTGSAAVEFPFLPFLIYMISMLVIIGIELIIQLMFIDYSYSHNSNDLSFNNFKHYLTSKELIGSLKVYGWQMIFIWLWSLIPIAGTIIAMIKTYSYSQSIYLYKEYNYESSRNAIDDSRIIMDGYKWELFKFYWSFFGWILLGYLTFGLGLLYVAPYIQLASIEFYKTLPKDKIN